MFVICHVFVHAWRKPVFTAFSAYQDRTCVNDCRTISGLAAFTYFTVDLQTAAAAAEIYTNLLIAFIKAYSLYNIQKYIAELIVTIATCFLSQDPEIDTRESQTQGRCWIYNLGVERIDSFY
ncbi:hypothetical protein ACJX0J_006569 [Zea mays]